MEDELLRDRIVCGVRDGTLRKQLLQKKTLTLSLCVDSCRASEASAKHLKAMEGEHEIHAVKQTGTSSDKKLSERVSFPPSECKYSQTSLFRHAIIRHQHFLTQVYVKPIYMDHFVLDLVSFFRHSDSDYDRKISLANPTYECAMSYLHCTCSTHGCQAETRGSLWRAEAPNLCVQARKCPVFQG